MEIKDSTRSALVRKGNELFNQKLSALQIPYATGIFGANMKVSITNDGPATFMLESRS